MDKTAIINANSQEAKNGKWDEIGASGLQEYSGYIAEAYNEKLNWPGCVDEYNRMWRSDPEIGIARTIIQSFAARVSLSFELQEMDDKPSDDDHGAEKFANQVLEDLEGGASAWLSSCLSRVLFYGWGWWEAPPAIRRPDWKPPDDDPWRSNYGDGLIGFRRLAFRHYKSFNRWLIQEPTGRVTGIEQIDPIRGMTPIPLERSLHIRFGDLDNPEGLATMEALWRLERVKYGLEIVFGIGAQHTAGHLNVTSEKKLDSNDEVMIKKAARMIMTAHEGNYAAWPDKVKGELVDVPFQGGTVILDAIRYFGILKLALLNMQWAALGTMSPYGSYAAISDASQFFVTWFNAIVEGIVKQADDQIGKRLFDYPINKAAFPGMTRRPILKASRVQKDVPLQEMGQFLAAISAIMPLDDDDYLAIRRKTEFLPETLPEIVSEPKPKAKSEPAQPGSGNADGSIDGNGAPDQDANLQMPAITGAMIAFFLEDSFAKRLAIPPGDLPDKSEAIPPEELHITLAFLGDTTAMGSNKGDTIRERATQIIRDLAGQFAPLSGTIGGVGRFLKEEGDGRTAFYASPDVPGIQEFRQELARALLKAELPISMEHSFTPHITLAYIPKDEPATAQFPTDKFTLGKLALSWGLEREYFPLIGERVAELALRPFSVPREEQTVDVTPESDSLMGDIDHAVNRFKKWAQENEPELAAVLDAKVEDAE